MQFSSYESYKLENKGMHKIKDAIVIEAPLQININKEPYTVVMRTPSDDYDLVRGLLFAEDIYKEKEEFSFVVEREKEGIPEIVNINLDEDQIGKGYLNKRTLLSVSSCGICGKKEIEDLQCEGQPLAPLNSFSVEDLEFMQNLMTQSQNTFQNTGGSHAAAIFDSKQQLLTVKEDIGRHNALDKAVGELLKKNQLHTARYLFVSGRVSYEIVSKAFIAKIGIIIAVSACSSLAIDFAKEFGICLIGFKRPQKLTLYSQPHYLNSTQHA